MAHRPASCRRNRFELETLIFLGVTSGQTTHPAFNEASCDAGCTVLTCSCTGSQRYWSSTNYPVGMTNTWVVSFGDATVNLVDKSTSN